MANIKWQKTKKPKTNLALQYEFSKLLRDAKFKNEMNINISGYFFNGINSSSYFLEADMQKIFSAIIKKNKEGQNLCKKDFDKGEKAVLKALTLSKDLKNTDFKKINNQGLVKLINVFKELFGDLLFFSFTGKVQKNIVLIEIKKLLSSDAIKALNVLEESIELGKIRKDLYSLASFAYNSGFGKEYKVKVGKFVDDYYWLSINAMEDLRITFEDADYIVKDLIALADPKKEFEKIEERLKKAEEKITLELTRLNEQFINKRVDFYRDVVSFVVDCKKSMSLAICSFELMARELSERQNIPFNEVILLTFEEMAAILSGEDYNNLETNRRKLGWAILFFDENTRIIPRHEFIAKAIKDYGIFSEFERLPESIEGNVPSQGVAIGAVVVIKKSEDLELVKNGDIIVAKTTSPDFIMAIKRASGIITDEGGVTCHAALISREQKIPCIIATGSASLKLNSGDMVVLDANEGIVWSIGNSKTIASQGQSRSTWARDNNKADVLKFYLGQF